MLLTSAASAASSLSVISQVLTTTSNNINNTNLKPSTRNPRISVSSSKESKSIASKSSRSKPSSSSSSSNQRQNPTNKSQTTTKKRDRLPRTDTSSSTATSSTTSSNSTQITEASSHSTRASSLDTTLSVESPLSALRNSSENTRYSVERPTTVDGASADIAADSNRSIISSRTSQDQEDTLSPIVPTTAAKQTQNSMRRRATDSISGSNLIPSSLRAVFRDNTNTSTATPAASITEQSNTTQEHSVNTQRNSTASNTSHPGESSSMTRNSTTTAPVASSNQVSSKSSIGNAQEMPSIKFIPHQDQRTARPSLAFAPMTRTLPDDTSIIRVGRYSERDVSPNSNNSPSAAPIGFKSKVVSRRHCEFWCSAGQWFVKDVKSSSGTFLNHIRLSQPSTESKPFPINDGDIIQLGMDFRGGEESIFRCVKIRIEVNRGWQKKLNDFNTTTHKALRALAKEAGPTSSTECSICLMSIAPCQALFVAPCSHVWHYKCIRPVINNPKMYPQFLCPNCRAVADLDADIEENVDGWDDTEDLPGNDGVTGEATGHRVGTPVNGHRTGEDSASINMTDDPSIVVQPPSSAPEPQQLASNNNSSISNSELQDTSAILFSEAAHIEIRDPRTVSDSLEGVVTPRNEAGPFVFDGTGRRVQDPQPA